MRYDKIWQAHINSTPTGTPYDLLFPMTLTCLFLQENDPSQYRTTTLGHIFVLQVLNAEFIDSELPKKRDFTTV